MKSLVNLGIRENQVGICDTQQVVNIEINLDAALFLDKLQDWNSASRHIGERAFSSDLADDFTAHLNKLMVIVGQAIKKHSSDIDIRLLLVPAAVVTTSEP